VSLQRPGVALPVKPSPLALSSTTATFDEAIGNSDPASASSTYVHHNLATSITITTASLSDKEGSEEALTQTSSLTASPASTEPLVAESKRVIDISKMLVHAKSDTELIPQRLYHEVSNISMEAGVSSRASEGNNSNGKLNEPKRLEAKEDEHSHKLEQPMRPKTVERISSTPIMFPPTKTKSESSDVTNASRKKHNNQKGFRFGSESSMRTTSTNSLVENDHASKTKVRKTSWWNLNSSSHRRDSPKLEEHDSESDLSRAASLSESNLALDSTGYDSPLSKSGQKQRQKSIVAFWKSIFHQTSSPVSSTDNLSTKSGSSFNGSPSASQNNINMKGSQSNASLNSLSTNATNQSPHKTNDSFSTLPTLVPAQSITDSDASPESATSKEGSKASPFEPKHSQISANGDDDYLILCRICEEEILSNVMDGHLKICGITQEHHIKLYGLDQKLKKLINLLSSRRERMQREVSLQPDKLISTLYVAN
jgi:hypothetical protein